MKTNTKIDGYILFFARFLIFSVVSFSSLLADVDASCGVYNNVLQTRETDSNISVYQGTLSYIYDAPSCQLDTGYVYKDDYDHGLECDNGEFASSSGQYGVAMDVNYSFETESADVSSSPNILPYSVTVTEDNQELSNYGYDNISQDENHYNFSLTYNGDKRINNFSSIINTVRFENLYDNNLYIGTFQTAAYDSTNVIFDGIANNIEIYRFENSGSNSLYIQDFSATESIKIGTFQLSSASSTGVTLRAPKIVIDDLNSTNDYNTITLYANEIDIGTINLAQYSQLIIHPYMEGDTVTFHSNSITASSSSTLILDSGDYYTNSLSIPGSADVSSVIASDDSQVINFFINGDFKPGNNPGINSNGNNGNFGTLTPSNFRLFINGDLDTGGGGTTFNALVYVEGGTDLGSPTYLRGALSSNYSIKIGDDSKFYYSDDINTSGFGDCDAFNDYIYQNDYSCGVLPTVLTSYKSISTQQNDVYNTCTISVKNYSLSEDENHPITCYSDITTETLCECDPSVSQCSHNGTCTIIPEPKNKLDYDIFDSGKNDTTIVDSDITFTDLKYGNYIFTGNGIDINFEPTKTYSDNDTKLMVLGDFTFQNNDQTLTFDGGDYFFNSFKIDKDTNGNINQINICAKDDIRLFINGDFVYSGNHINDSECGGKIFIYIEGDAEIDSNGGGSSDVPIFIYTKGNVIVENSGESNSWYGAITAEGDLNVTGQNINFTYDDSADAFGYGECQMCYSDIIINGMSMNFMGCAGISMMSDIKVPIFSTDTLDNVSVDEVHDETLFSFTFMGTNEVIDQNGTHIADAETTDSGWNNSAAGMDVSLYGGKAITYPLGSNYGPADDENGYYQLHSSSLFSMDFDPCEWEDSLAYVAHYEDSEGRHYDTILSPCNAVAAISNNLTVTTGPFDAWDTFRNVNDRNISTKITGKDFNLTIASLNDTNDDTEAKEGVDIQFQLYDMNNNVIVTPWYDYNASSAADGAEADKEFTNINKAYRNVRVRFKFCARTNNNGTLILGSLSYCDSNSDDYNASYDLNTSTFSTDAFAIRPYGFRVFGTNQYKRAAEDFNVTIKATNESNFTLMTPGLNLDSVSSVLNYNASLSSLNIISHFYTPSSSELATMQNDTGQINVATCPNAGIFTINNSTALFSNGEVNASLKFSETGILDINVSEKPGQEWAIIDADDTNDSVRYITPSILTYDKSDISLPTLLLFVPYEFETTTTYGTTTLQNWIYMNDINTTSTPNMSAYIKYTIVAKNKDGVVTQNFTKTCFPDTNSTCPRVNGLKLNTTFDLFLDATLNSTDSVNISLFTEDNNSVPIFTPNKHISLNPSDNNIQEWISPFQFINGSGEAVLYFNIDRNESKEINPVTIIVKDTNTSTSWMSNPGSPRNFISISPADSKIFYYGRVHAPDQRIEGNSGTAKVYYEVYCKDCNKTLYNINGKESIDSVNWYQNTLHTSGILYGTYYKNPPESVDGTVIGITNLNDMQLTAPQVPHKDKIKLKPNSWLKYIPTDFLVEFYNANVNWAGQGKLGTIVDTNVSKRTNRRLDW